MAAFTVFEPQWQAQGGVNLSPPVAQGFPDLVNGLFRKGDFVGVVTTGTITTPTPSGSGLTVAGPSLGANPVPFVITTSSSSITQGVVTVTATASTGAPILTYYCQVSYTSNGQSLPSVPFVIECIAGYTPLVSVSATGEPAGFTTFTLFCSTTPNTFWQQGSANTATGSTTGPAYPLTNHTGLNKLAAAFTTNCFGLADCDSDALYWQQFPANKRAPFGSAYNVPPGWDGYALSVPVVKLQTGVVELNLVQSWSTNLLYASTGFNIDTNTGYFVADTTQSAAGTIIGKAFDGRTTGDVGDTYSRVLVRMTASVLV